MHTHTHTHNGIYVCIYVYEHSYVHCNIHVHIYIYIHVLMRLHFWGSCWLQNILENFTPGFVALLNDCMGACCGVIGPSRCMDECVCACKCVIHGVCMCICRAVWLFLLAYAAYAISLCSALSKQVACSMTHGLCIICSLCMQCKGCTLLCLRKKMLGNMSTLMHAPVPGLP